MLLFSLRKLWTILTVCGRALSCIKMKLRLISQRIGMTQNFLHIACHCHSRRPKVIRLRSCVDILPLWNHHQMLEQTQCNSVQNDVYYDAIHKFYRNWTDKTVIHQWITRYSTVSQSNLNDCVHIVNEHVYEPITWHLNTNLWSQVCFVQTLPDCLRANSSMWESFSYNLSRRSWRILRYFINEKTMFSSWHYSFNTLSFRPTKIASLWWRIQIREIEDRWTRILLAIWLCFNPFSKRAIICATWILFKKTLLQLYRPEWNWNKFIQSCSAF